MKTIELAESLKQCSYPGRGIIAGRSGDGNFAVAAYFIMGRSENSRNRIFIETEDGIRTEAFDPKKLTDPSLIIYHPVRVYKDTTIVTNGDQTDTIRDSLVKGKDYIDALRQREFEPDAPNYTPRISAVIDNRTGIYALSILKSLQGNPDCCQRSFFEYDSPVSGYGHFIHTYQQDGEPLPSFAGEPELVRIAGGIDEFTSLLWDSLNQENKVSLFVRYLKLSDGTSTTVIRNKNTER